VLVAEDETIIRLDLVEMLTEAGYEVVAQAENGAIAIELAKEFKPDLAILDVKMPVVDGITAAEQIIPIAPVLMLTAFSQRELVERARDAGVMAYVVKPFSLDRKVIDRAKGILMKAMNLSEPESYSWIQRTAMDRRISMKAVAEAVINPDAMPNN
jgi:response regulator NasT